MGSLIARGDVKEAAIEAVVIKADGTRVNLGTVAYYNRNPVAQFLHGIRSKFANMRRGTSVDVVCSDNPSGNGTDERR